MSKRKKSATLIHALNMQNDLVQKRASLNKRLRAIRKWLRANQEGHCIATRHKA